MSFASLRCLELRFCPNWAVLLCYGGVVCDTFIGVFRGGPGVVLRRFAPSYVPTHCCGHRSCRSADNFVTNDTGPILSKHAR